jgi:hypothetical protein
VIWLKDFHSPYRQLQLCAGAILHNLCGCGSARHHSRSSRVAATTTSKARRLQRQRQADRALATVAAANRRLCIHHGSASMANKARGKGSGSGKGGAPKGCKAPGPHTAAADGRLKAALDAKTAAEAKAKESNRVQASLRAELKKLKDAASTAPTLAADAGMDLDIQGSEASILGMEAAISGARDELKQTQSLSDFQKSLLPDFEAALAAAHAKVEAALVARRAASPLKKQLEGAEGHQQRSAKKVADGKSALELRRKELAEAQAAVLLQEQGLAALEAVLAKADTQVAELAARCASERNAGAAVQVAGEGATQAADGAAANGHSEGFVSLAMVEARWKERELEFQRIIEETRALAVSERTHSLAPSQAAASDVADIASLDQVESFEEDEKWIQVARDKRKAVLSRQRDVLATKVSRSPAKVSLIESPFSKKSKLVSK